jgi:3-hydroxyisobutyrate dehydrogenase-like beta-hydroxyacid dehydrogenase
MIRALSGGLAGSKCLDQKAEKILSGDFAPGFKIDLHSKDLNLIADAARSVGVPIPTAAFVEQLFARFVCADVAAWIIRESLPCSKISLEFKSGGVVRDHEGRSRRISRPA